VHVDLFETAVAQSLGLPSQRCITAEFCGKGLAVEHDGDVFSCDHYVYPEYRLGNIADVHLGDDGLLRAAEEVRVRQARRSAAVLQGMPTPEALLGRVPQEPPGAHTVGRGRAQLSVSRQETQHPHHLGRRHRQFNISAYNMGMMGYKTPNIDRIAKEGAIFTDWYGQQSCTAGRAAFITGQSPIRTGLTKVGLPGAPEGSAPRTRPSPRCSRRRAT
jgi:hypothetical protein